MAGCNRLCHIRCNALWIGAASQRFCIQAVVLRNEIDILSIVVHANQVELTDIFQNGNAAFIVKVFEHQLLLGFLDDISAAGDKIAHLCIVTSLILQRFVQRQHLWGLHAAQLITVELVAQTPIKRLVGGAGKVNIIIDGIAVHTVKILKDGKTLKAAVPYCCAALCHHAQVALSVDIMQLSCIQGVFLLRAAHHLAGGKLFGILIEPAARTDGRFQHSGYIVRHLFDCTGGWVIQIQAADWVIFVGSKVAVAYKAHRTVAVQHCFTDFASQLFQLAGFQIADPVQLHQTVLAIHLDGKDVLCFGGNIVDSVFAVQQVQLTVVQVAAADGVAFIVQLEHLQQSVVRRGFDRNDVLLPCHLRHRAELTVLVTNLLQLSVFVQLVVVNCQTVAAID